MVFLHLLYLLLARLPDGSSVAQSTTRPSDAIRFLRRPDASRGVIALVCAVLVAGGAWASGSADAAVSVSSNWAGYAVVPSGSRASAFSRVSGSWAVPTATCSGRGETYAAAWVGLGGFHESSRALEQIGTDADCTRTGNAVYSAWYELVPAAPVTLKLKVHAGDVIAASVSVKGHGVTLRIRDLSTGSLVTRRRRVTKVDLSSAEWIVEAPSVCVTTRICGTLALTDFGNIALSQLEATERGHTGSVEDRRWKATELELREAQSLARGPRASAARTAATAVPTALSSSGSAFAVTWGEQAIQTEQPAPPTLPGFSGGPA